MAIIIRGIYLLLALCIHQQLTTCAEISVIESISYQVHNDGKPLILNMSSPEEITAIIMFNKDAIPARGADKVSIKFRTKTLSPQFNILGLDPATGPIVFDRKSLELSKYTTNVKLKLSPNYIGHALLEPVAVEFTDKVTQKTSIVPLVETKKYMLQVTIVQSEGVWGKIFIVSVIILMIISYINLGAQLDEDNMRQVIKKPLSLVSGFLISVLVMPIITWYVGKLLLRSQILYRIGSFVFACSPAASASSLWTVMLNSDKELSVGLQVVSNLGALVTMPLLLFVMEHQFKVELGSSVSNNHVTAVPYGRLIQALVVLLLALLVGWRIVGRNERAQMISRRIFRPLVFSVLIFIVVFSSVLYWHIYQMFDRINLSVALITTLSTYLIASILGYICTFDMNRTIAITIGAAYKNSGITFGVLLVAFGSPDTFIAYVPCLAQIVITSLSLYLIYSLLSLYRCITRRGKSVEVQDRKSDKTLDGQKADSRRRNSSRDTNAAEDNSKDEENDEFIALNVTDIMTDSIAADSKSSRPVSSGDKKPSVSRGEEAMSFIDGRDQKLVTDV